MATVVETLKSALINYPTLYPEKIDVWISILTKKPWEYEWKNGQLINVYGGGQLTKMDYSDLNERANSHDPSQENGPMNSYYAHRKVEIEAEKMQRKFIEKNLDVICQDSWTTNLFRQDYLLDRSQTEWILQSKPFEDVICFNFPDDIQQDWGKLLEDFYSWTEVRLNNHYGLSQKTEMRTHWPEKALTFLQTIEDARERLFPLLNNGQSLEDHRKEMKVFTQKIFADIFNDEKSKSSPRSRMK